MRWILSTPLILSCLYHWSPHEILLSSRNYPTATLHICTRLEYGTGSRNVGHLDRWLPVECSPGSCTFCFSKEGCIEGGVGTVERRGRNRRGAATKTRPWEERIVELRANGRWGSAVCVSMLEIVGIPMCKAAKSRNIGL